MLHFDVNEETLSIGSTSVSFRQSWVKPLLTKFASTQIREYTGHLEALEPTADFIGATNPSIIYDSGYVIVCALWLGNRLWVSILTKEKEAFCLYGEENIKREETLSKLIGNLYEEQNKPVKQFNQQLKTFKGSLAWKLLN